MHDYTPKNGTRKPRSPHKPNAARLPAHGGSGRKQKFKGMLVGLAAGLKHKRGGAFRGLLCYWGDSKLLNTGGGLGQFWHKKMRVLHLDVTGDAPRQPVLHTLHTHGRHGPYDLDNFGRATQRLDQVRVSLDLVHDPY